MHCFNRPSLLFFAGNSAGRVFARVLERSPHTDLGQHDEPGRADLGQRSEVLDSRPVHQTTAGDESVDGFPRHSVDTAVQKQHTENQHRVTRGNGGCILYTVKIKFGKYMG